MNNSNRRSRVFLSNLLALIAAAFFAALFGRSEAATLQASGQFDIDVFNTPNDFVTAYGLADGDTVSVTGRFDDTGLTGSGEETAVFDTFALTVGGLALDETDDVDCCANFPAIQFQDGMFRNFLFLADDTQSDGNYEIVVEDFMEVVRGPGSEDLLVVQNTTPIDSTTIMIQPVPLPAALPLFGAALGMLAFCRGRRGRART